MRHVEWIVQAVAGAAAGLCLAFANIASAADSAGGGPVAQVQGDQVDGVDRLAEHLGGLGGDVLV